MLDVNKILHADVLDIIFEGRNKEYGAYELRSNYSKRLSVAVIYMLCACGLMLLLYSFATRPDEDHAREVVIADHQLEEVKPKEEIPPPVELPKPKPQPVAITQFTPPKIVNDDVKPDEAPPEIAELEDTKIGTIDQEGDKDLGIVAPPISDDGKGVIEIQKKEEEPEVYLTVQIESEYPGGLSAWQRYLNRNLRYPQDAIEKEIQGVVMVQFIVDKTGVVSDVQAISGPEELRPEAVRVIKKSGSWTPAIQNGRQVKSYKRQPIKFELLDE